ncbi:hypothetical protein EDB86DRAFT_3186805 [Lactarius hatsudake]|nr:hypothetical protein EDB86DRAFT_3186805 [Lactarius hatsudake]
MWQEFLVEHAKFPFPVLVESGSVSITDISPMDVGNVAPEWRAKYTVPDETLVQKLCTTLDNILGDTVLPDGSRNDLLKRFGRHVEFRTIGGTDIKNRQWSVNDSEVRSQYLLSHGCFEAVTACLGAYGRHQFYVIEEHTEQGLSKVDHLVTVDDKRAVLVEVESPSAMKAVGDLLPTDARELDWYLHQSLVSNLLLKAALYLGLRKMEWLFLTCHNYWVVCRLVSNDGNPFLAYSPLCSIEDSSEPFRALLGAILSVLKGAPVQASEFNPAMVPDTIPTIPEKEEGGSSPEDDVDDGSGEYWGSSTTNISSEPPMTRSRATTSRDAPEFDLMFTSSAPHYPKSYQVWVRLHSLPNNTLVLPHCAENGNGNRRLWLTRHIGAGSTGSVWECRFDNSDDLFAIKVIELQRRSGVERQQRFYNEFEVYLSLEIGYQSGQLRDRITPHCYGAFEGGRTDILILELCGDTLKGWDELNFSEQTQVYGLIWDLHRVGIVHGDLEPRNIARVPGGGFRLIDFSESVRHTCVEISGKLNKRYKCPELQAMRGVLKLLQRHASVRTDLGAYSPSTDQHHGVLTPMQPSLSGPAAVNN